MPVPSGMIRLPKTLPGFGRADQVSPPIGDYEWVVWRSYPAQARRNEKLGFVQSSLAASSFQ